MFLTMYKPDERIAFSLSPDDKERLRRIAEAEGRSLANAARRLVLAGLGGRREASSPEPGASPPRRGDANEPC